MNIKKLILSLFAVAMLATTAKLAYAYFNSQGQSLGNSFSTGTLTIALSDDNETSQSSVNATFGGTLNPGDCTGVKTLQIKNTGTIPADHGKFSVVNTLTDTGDNASPDMDAFIKLNTLNYDGTTVLPAITDSNGNGFKDLADLAAGGGISNLSLANLNTNHPIAMDVCLDGSAGNTLQGDSVSSTFTVTLYQNAIE